MLGKAPDAFRTISEVGEDLGLPQHVLRFWETRFPAIRPLKRGGNRRYYRPDDIDLLKGIQALLYGQGYTIKGVQRIIKEGGPRAVQAIGRGEAVPVRPGPAPDDEPALDAEADRAGQAAAGADLPESPDPAPDARQADRLRAALEELLECRRILANLREAPPEDL